MLPSNIDVHVLNIHTLVSNIHILISQKKYRTLAYNDILPDILTIEILSSCWKRGKHKNTFLVSKNEAVKQMVAVLCLGKVVAVD